MIRLAISVEGPTELEFVKDVLADHLRERGVEAQPILPGGQGGSISIDRLAPEMARLVWNFDYVTSLVDFYGFKDKGTASVSDLEHNINQAVRQRIHQSWDEYRVFAYVQQYEFEALLFSDVSVFDLLEDVSNNTITQLGRIRTQFETPEDINDSPITAPSKRITELVQKYRKRRDGPDLAAAIGLDAIRSQCRRFDEWVNRMESLGSQPESQSETR